jgi:DNA end-binding protein Ku
MPATVWKGSISFGLVSFPVRLFSAARAKAVHFHMLHRKDLSRVKEVWYCAEEDKPIDRADMVKGYQVTKGNYVAVEDEEIRKIAPATATSMEVLQFVASGAVDPLLFERSYYVAAESAAAKPYTLFLVALSETRQDAIAKMSMHGREHVVLIRATAEGLVLHTLYYSDELNQANRAEVPKAQYTAKELELAKSLIDHLKGPSKLNEFEDTFRANVERMIEQKKKGEKITAVKQPRKAAVVDLMEALKRSLQAIPSEKAPPRKKSNRAA